MILGWFPSKSVSETICSIITKFWWNSHWMVPDTYLEGGHPRTIPPKFGCNWPSGFWREDFYVNFS
jgi:hypothetical protein